MNNYANSKTPRELNGFRLLGYTGGTFGRLIANILIGTYAASYYTYTINLDASLAGVGSFLYQIVFAFCSIVFGPIIDNAKPGKLGKRRPFLLYSSFVWLIANIVIWIPPLAPRSELPVLHWETALFFWCIMSLRAITESIMVIASSSMLPEQSQTVKNREKVATLTGVLQITSSIISIGIPMILQSLIDPENAQHWTSSGNFIMTFMFISSIISTGIGFILIIFAYLSVDESFHKKLGIIFEKKEIKEAFRQLRFPVKDKIYRKFLVATIFEMIAGGIMGSTLFPFLWFILARGLSEEQSSSIYLWYIIISIFCKFGWLVFWKIILNKKKEVVKIYRISYNFAVIVSFFEFLFLINLSFIPRLFLFVFTFGTILGITYASALYITPLITGMIDLTCDTIVASDQVSFKKNNLSSENEEIQKEKAVSAISGSYYGFLNFIISIASGLTSLLLGFIFTGKNAKDSLIITIVFASMSFFFLLELIMLYKIKIKIKIE